MEDKIEEKYVIFMDLFFVNFDIDILWEKLGMICVFFVFGFLIYVIYLLIILGV